MFFFPPLRRSFTSLTSFRAKPSVKSRTKGSRPMRRVRRRMNFFSNALKSRFVSSSWRFNQPLSLCFSSFFKGVVVQNYLQKWIIICNIVSGRRTARTEWTEPETRGGEWAIQTGNFMISFFVICCFISFETSNFSLQYFMKLWWVVPRPLGGSGYTHLKVLLITITY